MKRRTHPPKTLHLSYVGWHSRSTHPLEDEVCFTGEPRRDDGICPFHSLFRHVTMAVRPIRQCSTPTLPCNRENSLMPDSVRVFTATFFYSLLVLAGNVRADGPQDNAAQKVRPIPPLGIEIDADERRILEGYALLLDEVE